MFHFIFILFFFLSSFTLDVKAENIIGSIIVERSPAGVAVNSLTNRIYVSNNQSDTVSVVDGTTNKVIKTITVGKEPYGVAVNEITNKIYVVHIDTVSVINGNTDEVETVFSVGGDSVGIAVNQKTNKIYVTSEPTNTLSVINGDTNEVESKLEIEDGTIEVAVNPNTNHIYVTSKDSKILTVIDGETSSVIKTHKLEDNVIDVTVNTSNDKVYVISATDVGSVFGERQIVENIITVINDKKGEIKTDIIIPGSLITVEVNSATNRVYVSALELLTGANVVYIIDGSTNRVVDYIIVSNLPSAISINKKTNVIYVAELSGGSISGSVAVVNSVFRDTKGFGPKIFIKERLEESLNIIDSANIELLRELNGKKGPITKRVNHSVNGMRKAIRQKNSRCVKKFLKAFKLYRRAVNLIEKRRCRGKKLDPTLASDKNLGCLSERVVQNFILKTILPFFQLTIAILIDDDVDRIPTICEGN